MPYIKKYIANITLKRFTERYFTLWFYNVSSFIMLLKQWAKEEKEDYTFLRKKQKKNKTVLSK